MSYKIVFDRPADKSFRRLPQDIKQLLARRISALAENPRPPDSKKLEGTQDCYRLRQGEYRVIYTIIDDRVMVIILRVGHRGSVYRGGAELARSARKHKGAAAGD